MDTGNLSDLGTQKVVGHVSLEGRFVGLSWVAAELFPAPAMESLPIVSSSDQHAVAENERLDSPDSDIERALTMIRSTLGQS